MSPPIDGDRRGRRRRFNWALVGILSTASAAMPAPAVTALASVPASEPTCAYVTSWGGEDVCGVQVPDGRVLGCVRTGKKPHGVALSSDGSRLYVSNEGSDTSTVVDAASLRVITEIPVGHVPNQVALSPSGDRLWVTNNADSTVTIIDTATNAVVRTLPVGRSPHIIVTNPARNVAVITSEGDGALDVFDLSTLERLLHVPVYGFPRVLAMKRSGEATFSTIRWLNGALLVDLEGRGPSDRVALGEPLFAPEGKDAHGITLTPDDRILLLTTQMTDQLTFVDARTLDVLDQIHVGKNPNWVDVTPDGRTAAVSTTDDDSVSIVDISSRKVISTARVGRQPKRLVVGRCAAAPRGGE